MKGKNAYFIHSQSQLTKTKLYFSLFSSYWLFHVALGRVMRKAKAVWYCVERTKENSWATFKEYLLVYHKIL